MTMSNAPIIIKRKKIVQGGGHHGGAWKVAYADFVTAMMAFFMLMWLLNATTEQQRKGIADYFAPTLPIYRISGGGDGMFGGDNIFSNDTLARTGTGGITPSDETSEISGETMGQIAALRDIEDILLGIGGDSALAQNALRHIATRLSDEGLIIEIFDLPNAPLFNGSTDLPTDVTREIAAMFARLFVVVENDVAITGHLQPQSVLRLENPIWTLSTGRAASMQLMLEDGGLDPDRIARITGAGDRNPAVTDSTAVRNNRLEVVLLRSDI
jgi:chemotaxis protein MotB